MVNQGFVIGSAAARPPVVKFADNCNVCLLARKPDKSARLVEIECRAGQRRL
jgi:hypothetical protein